MRTDGTDGGPAYPLRNSEALDRTWSGMSLRDWFAGQALQGILAGGFADTVPHDAVDDEAAFYAYKYADEMLAQRSK